LVTIIRNLLPDAWWYRSKYNDFREIVPLDEQLDWLLRLLLLPALAVGLWRYRRVHTLTGRTRGSILAGVMGLAVLAALWGGTDVGFYVLLGLGTQVVWGVAWGEGTSAVMRDGPVGRVLWSVFGCTIPIALAAAYAALYLGREIYDVTKAISGHCVAVWLIAGLWIGVATVRSHLAHRRARLWLAHHDGRPAEEFAV
jgi:hypothetical protein